MCPGGVLEPEASQGFLTIRMGWGSAGLQKAYHGRFASIPGGLERGGVSACVAHTWQSFLHEPLEYMIDA